MRKCDSFLQKRHYFGISRQKSWEIKCYCKSHHVLHRPRLCYWWFSWQLLVTTSLDHSSPWSRRNLKASSVIKVGRLYSSVIIDNYWRSVLEEPIQWWVHSCVCPSQSCHNDEEHGSRLQKWWDLLLRLCHLLPGRHRNPSGSQYIRRPGGEEHLLLQWCYRIIIWNLISSLKNRLFLVWVTVWRTLWSGVGC